MRGYGGGGSIGSVISISLDLNMHEPRINYGSRHPKNRFGQGSPEFYEEEVRLYGFTSVEEFCEWHKRTSLRCPVCGTPRGYSFGTGDCGCLG